MVKLYTINCQKCIVLEKKLLQKGIEFEKITDFDVKFFREKGIMSAPILEVDGDFLIYEKAVDWVNNK